METEKVDFTGVEWGSVEWTNLCTLYLRAYESRSASPVLGDRTAAEAVGRIDYDFARLHRATRPRSNRFMVALRARRLDLWAADFLARHPDAAVLHLGCGLDGRAFRIGVPERALWFDLDLPGVVGLRRRLYPERPGYRLVGASVTDPSWLEEVPADRPVLVIAEGLLMFLDEEDVALLLHRITDRFGSGEVLFDALARWAARASGLIRWGVRDARDAERPEPALTLRDEVPLTSRYADIPARGTRLVYRLMNAVPATRRVSRQYRFSF